MLIQSLSDLVVNADLNLVTVVCPLTVYLDPHGFFYSLVDLDFGGGFGCHCPLGFGELCWLECLPTPQR